jgi:nucleotide-binding universal stress UspA family protein
MAKFKKILLAYDGSDASRNALDQAVVLLRASEGAELVIVVVMHPPEAGMEMIGMSEALGRLEEAAGRIAEDAAVLAEKAGLTYRAVTRKGSPYLEITGLAEEEDADLIVTGRRGVTGLERVLMGSVTSRVIGRTTRDVLVIPRGGRMAFDAVIAATDGSKLADNALERALGFSVDYNVASLTAVSVVDMNAEIMALSPGAVEKLTGHYEKTLEKAIARSEAAGMEAGKSIIVGEVSDGIVRAARESGANMIFMGTHGRTGMVKFFMGSVTEKVIGLSPVPVYVARGAV